MPGKTFNVSLVTPEGAAYEGEVEMLIVPGADGEIGVLARHAPLVALLNAGSTRIYRDRQSDDVVEFATGPGFFKVEQDRALALVDDAVDSRQIDDTRAREQLEQAQAKLAAAVADWEKAEAGPRLEEKRAAWATAEPVTDFWQYDPDTGLAVSEPLEVRLLYDDDALYVGARISDRQIVKRLVRRDGGSAIRPCS